MEARKRNVSTIPLCIGDRIINRKRNVSTIPLSIGNGIYMYRNRRIGKKKEKKNVSADFVVSRGHFVP
jgi:hypothetical protein